jgi:hypothetical protein
MQLSSPSGDKYISTVVNPNAPANRRQETPGLCISLDGPANSDKATRTTRELTEAELETLRSGAPLTLTFGEIAVELQSNAGGHLVSLESRGPPRHRRTAQTG